MLEFIPRTNQYWASRVNWNSIGLLVNILLQFFSDLNETCTWFLWPVNMHGMYGMYGMSQSNEPYLIIVLST